MKKLIILVALLTLGVFPSLAQKAAPAKAATESTPFVSAEGKFSILFPGEPQRKVEPVGSDEHKFDMYSFEIKSVSPVVAAYQVHYFDLAEAVGMPAGDLFEMGNAGFLEGVKGGRILDQMDVKVGSNPARVVRVAQTDGTFFKMKWIVAGPRIYQITVGFPSKGRSLDDTIRSSEAIADKFLDSFTTSAK